MTTHESIEKAKAVFMEKAGEGWRLDEISDGPPWRVEVVGPQFSRVFDGPTRMEAFAAALVAAKNLGVIG